MKPIQNLWPLGIIITFALFFCSMALVVVIASTHREYLVHENYYEQEIKFQDQIDSARRAQAAGAAIAFDGANGLVQITLPVVHLAPKFFGTIELYRPSAPKLDREFLLEPRADGTQTLKVAQLAAGLWLVRVKWNANGTNYFLEQKITAPGNL